MADSGLESWEIDRAIVTKLESGFVTVQCEGIGANPQLDFFVVHHPHGFRSQPVDGGADGTGCGVLYAYEGGRGHAWLLADGRYVADLPDEGRGGSLQYAVVVPPGGGAAKIAYLRLLGTDGSAEIRVPDTADHVRLEHGESGPHLELKADAAALRGPQGLLELLVSAGAIDLGGAGGGPVARAMPAFLAWLAAVGAATGVGAPPGDIASTKVRAVL